MIKSWEELLLETTDSKNAPIRQLIADSSDNAWPAWGKLVQKRMGRLMLDEYRNAMHWAYALPETRACFEKEVPIETEIEAVLASGQTEYHALAMLLSLTLVPDAVATQTSRQWAARLSGTLNWVTGLTKKSLSVENQALLHQLSCAETPWLIGCMFPDLSVGQKMLQIARENFRLGLTEILDGSGLPSAADHLLLRPLLACWTRSLMIGKRAQLRPWTAEVHQQFEWAVQHTLRFMRKDGTPIFSDIEPTIKTTAQSSTKTVLPKTASPKTASLKKGANDVSVASDSCVPFEFERFAEMVRHALAFDSDEADHAVARTLFPRSFAVKEIASTRMALMQNNATPKKAVSVKKTATAKKSVSKKTSAALADEKKKTASFVEKTSAAYFSEWAQVAMFRSAWGFRDASLAMAYRPINEFRQTLTDAKMSNTEMSAPFGGWSDQSVCTELNLAGRTIWNGHWNVAIRVDGRTLLPTDTWSQTCEITDEDADYMEIELPLTENMRLQRHLLLCHSEKLLLLADSLLPQFDDDSEDGDSEPHTGFDDKQYAIEYESQIPLTSSINVKTNSEATELLLTGASASGATSGKVAAVSRVFPMALAEWQTELENHETTTTAGSVAGELTTINIGERSALVLRQHTKGRALFAPLVFDLDAKRVKEPYTWRQLTTGENLEVVRRDRAVAFRLQIAKLHFLLYRSLTNVANRTFFGHNLASDFFAGRFDAKTGLVTAIVEVE